VREVRADVGIAVDGDADRVVVVDECGNALDGDMLMALFARELNDRKALRGDGVVATVMSNLGLEKWLERLGLTLHRTQVGDRYVVELMRSAGFNLGGEQSGHLIFLDHARTGDGMMAALQTLAIMARSQRKLSELIEGFERYPQVILNVRVAQKRPIESLPSLQAAIRDVESQLRGNGRVLIRYSGTEPKARIMVEGQDERRVSQLAQQLADELVRALGGGA
jgi:phosphoglucosamine mutase